MGGVVVAEMGEVGEGGVGGEEGGHAPLGEPALEGDVVGFVADGGGGDCGGVVGPGRGEARGGGEERGEFGGGQAAVIVFVEEEEEVDKEAVAGWGELGGGVEGDVEFGVEEGGVEGEAVGVMECAEDEPDCFVTPLFGEHFIEEDESFFGYPFGTYGRFGALGDCLFDVFEIVYSEGLAKTFGLEIMHLVVAQVAILIFVAQVEHSF